MDIRPERSHYPAVIPAERTLPACRLQNPLPVRSSGVSGAGIDCVEICDDSAPAPSVRPGRYGICDDDPAPVKGRWIDLWI